MKQIIILALLLASLSYGKDSWELVVKWDMGTVTLLSSRIIAGAPKESRKPKAQSGPASGWSWQIQSASGEVLKEARFVLPTHYCTSEEHLELKSSEMVLTIPQVVRGVKVVIIENPVDASAKSGDVHQSRTAGRVVAEFSLPGGAQ